MQHFQFGNKVLVLSTDTNKLLLQWIGLYDASSVVGCNNYKVKKVMMKGKEKTLHANLLMRYVLREDFPAGDAALAVAADDQHIVSTYMVAIEDYEMNAGIQDTDDLAADIPNAEDLPKIGV